jgi:hypothetical protein
MMPVRGIASPGNSSYNHLIFHCYIEVYPMASDPLKIHVPESELPYLKFLAHVDTEFFEALTVALQKSAPNINSDSLSHSIAR